ncbi:MAG: hypothetical protein ACLGGV_05205 [Bacteroidia bacterium]
MKQFSLLKTVVFVVELIAYLELLGGVLFVIYLSMNDDEIILGYSLGVIVLFWIGVSVPTLVVAHLLKLIVALYETTYESLQTLKEINRELKNKPEQSAEILLWKNANPGKSINDFYKERQTNS